MQSLAAKVSNHRPSRTGSPLQPVESPGCAVSASPTPRLSALAPAAALSLPSLTGIPSSYEHYDGDARLFAFLRRLAELGIAGTAPAAIENRLGLILMQVRQEIRGGLHLTPLVPKCGPAAEATTELQAGKHAAQWTSAVT